MYTSAPSSNVNVQLTVHHNRCCGGFGRGTFASAAGFGGAGVPSATTGFGAPVVAGGFGQPAQSEAHTHAAGFGAPAKGGFGQAQQVGGFSQTQAGGFGQAGFGKPVPSGGFNVLPPRSESPHHENFGVATLPPPSAFGAHQLAAAVVGPFGQANSAQRFDYSAVTFETEFHIPRDTFSDWQTVTEILLEECGLSDFEIADSLTRADAIEANSGIVGLQQTLLNALLVKRRQSDTSKHQSPRCESNDQMWLRINHARKQEEEKGTTVNDTNRDRLQATNNTAANMIQTSVVTKRQWSKVATDTKEKRSTDPLEAPSVRLVVDIFYHAVTQVGFRNVVTAQGGSGAAAPSQSGFGAAAPSQGGFGTAAPAQGGFGTAAPAAQGGFGTAAPSQGGFGAAQTQTQGGFGTTAATPAQSAFGTAPSQGGFGAAATLTKGQCGASAPARSVGKVFPAPGGFGTAATPAPSGFGAAAPAQSSFGKVPAPATAAQSAASPAQSTSQAAPAQSSTGVPADGLGTVATPAQAPQPSSFTSAFGKAN
ncbi:Hypothetical protein, putative [Bodo saltans]|uniref:Nucleoporin n=1 Tax=Bodo saltans TaxID=75058 RepID=A0A0S4IMQ1_BODSA|nr:Hypothetical protein, putative [Bodo saltans]|eukprot:CUE74277.1 Hypothetical protein, putative [Bodo saltans]